MIEKIPDQIPVQTGEWRGTTFDIIPKETFGMACRKINELVDAVNELQATISKMEQVETPPENVQPDAESRPENVQDKFAEQRKWIGKLCKFWDIDNNNLYYGPLTKIHDTSPYCYECNHKMCYAFCEPVKDDIIYKGE